MRWSVFDLAQKEEEVAEIEKEASRPEFWEDTETAQNKMRRLSFLKAEMASWRGIEKEISELGELVELAGEEPSLDGEIRSEMDRLAARLEDMELELALGGPFDGRNAILGVHAGAGGTDAQDWAEMLLRMYLRWAERRGYKANILEVSPGEEAGIKSALLEVLGDYAYGYLKAERGVHRLVRLSPFDASHARHTSFALVEVMPEAEKDVDIDLNPEDLKSEFFRASGHGGQNVQKTSTAVRITHIPTGIIATCQKERSQFQNRENALKVLRSRLLELELAKRAEEEARIKGEHVAAGWGNQIRSYVIHPYKMVKDHRTDHEVGNAEAVLDGRLDDFIEAYLRQTAG